MTTEPIVEHDRAGEPASSATDEQLIAMLVDRARGDGLKLTGEGGLLQKLTKRVLESALEVRSLITSATTNTTRRAAAAGTLATGIGPRAC